MNPVHRPGASHISRSSLSAAMRDEAAAWAVRLDEGSLSPDVERKLADWLKADPQHASALQQAVALWRQLDAVPAMPAASSASGGHRRRSARHAHVGARRTTRRVLWTGLACALVLTALQLPRASLWLQSDQQTATGEQRQIELIGGGTALLDTRSAIAIHDTQHWREVVLLQGAAAFNVGHHDPRPFRVRTGDWTMTDVGTRFELTRLDGHLQLVVSSGVVDLDGPSGHRRIQAGEQATIALPDGSIQLHTGDVDSATAWTRGRLVFENQPLRDVVESLNRYYSGHILILGPALGRRRVSGVFKTSAPLAAVDALQHSLGLQQHRLGRRLVILLD